MRAGLSFLLGTLLVAVTAAHAEAPYHGRRLVDVLEEFRGDGVELIYSTALVDPDWVIGEEPTPPESGGAHATLRAILTPFGLTLEEGPGDTWLVVEAATAPGSPSPPVPSAFVTEIVVTPSQHTVRRDEQGARFAMNRDDAVAAPASGGDVGRVVQLIPGVSAPDNSAAFRIRGSSSRDASILLDGLELYDPFHLDAFQSPFSLIDANSVDRIDLRAGGYTAELGDRHGGFVEIATLVPQQRSGELELGTLNSRFSIRAPSRHGHASWLFSARTWYSDAIFDSTEIGAGEDVQPRFQDLYVKGTFTVTPRAILSLHGLFGHDRLEFVETDEDVNEAANVLTRNGNVWLRSDTVWTPMLRTDLTLSFGRIDKERNGISAPEDDALEVRDHRTVEFIGLRGALYRASGERRLWKAGFDYRSLDAEYRYALTDPGDPTPPPPLSLDPRGSSISAFGALRQRLGDRWTAEWGLRWDRQTYTEDTQISPRINAVYRPDPRSELRLAAGRYFQSQRIHELDVQDGDTSFRRSESSDQIEVAYERLLAPGFRLRIDAYHRWLRHLRPRYENLFEPIEVFPETATDRVLVAPDRARLRGVELLLRSPADQALFWWAGYSLASADDFVSGRWVPRDWDQRHSVKLLIGYRVPGRWSVALSGTAHSGWPTTPVSGEIVQQPDGSLEPELIVGPRNADRFGGYRRVDLKARRGFERRRGRVWLTLDVSNLLDEKNTCCVDDFVFEYGPPGPTTVGRQYDSWLGIRPAFSVLWEF